MGTSLLIAALKSHNMKFFAVLALVGAAVAAPEADAFYGYGGLYGAGHLGYGLGLGHLGHAALPAALPIHHGVSAYTGYAGYGFAGLAGYGVGHHGLGYHGLPVIAAAEEARKKRDADPAVLANYGHGLGLHGLHGYGLHGYGLGLAAAPVAVAEAAEVAAPVVVGRAVHSAPAVVGHAVRVDHVPSV